jgi:2-polyprenyl-6-methoxyphenol hydroxylase-like FAD-dependent oxidoreductase
VLICIECKSALNAEREAMAKHSILISGGGVAGSTLAYWLAERGFAPTIVERAAGLRSSGNPVDVRGPALEVARAMGIVPALQAAATAVTRLDFVGRDGRTLASLGTRSESDEVEIPRKELARILTEAAGNRAELIYGDSIESLTQDATGVDVTFERAEPRRFDLVVGADGTHSRVRSLAFGAEAGFVEHLGLFVATLPLDGLEADPGTVVMFNAPGTSVSIHPSTGTPIAAFIFRGARIEGLDYRDAAQHKAVLERAYAGGGWRVPELLDRLRAAPDLYFDAVSRTRMPSWSSGRVALLGDAASSVSLFGEGSSLAITGGETVARALGANPNDHARAFAEYEREHRRLVAPRQAGVGRASRLLVPASRGGLAARNAGARMLSAIMARGGRR